MAESLNLQQLGLLKYLPICAPLYYESLKLKSYDECNSLDYNIKKFHEYRAQVFNSVLNKTLLGIRVFDPDDPVTKTYSQNLRVE